MSAVNGVVFSLGMMMNNGMLVLLLAVYIVRSPQHTPTVSDLTRNRYLVVVLAPDFKTLRD